MNRNLRIKVDLFITNLTSINLHHFYLETIQAGIQEPIESFVDYLFTLVEYGELILKYELKCPEYDCGCKIIYDKYDEIPFNEYVHDYKGHEIFVEKDNVVPYFKIPNELKITRKEAIAEKKDENRITKDMLNCDAVLNQDVNFHDSLAELEKKWPGMFAIFQYVEGDVIMSESGITKQVVSGNQGNVNQSIGDNAKNINTQNIDDHSKLFAEAKKEISLSDLKDDEKKDAIVMIETAEGSYNSGSKDKAKTFLKMLPDLIKTIPAVITLIQHIS
ncbi:hypothetical protein D932_01606 [Enterococcus casseliflavus 14-MB-W-14]|uniref:hypothetical protein n=1 Tax=Enterococcus casseliflavus TaxID=37734 RepID=UPI0003538884|nr:hypothetical protein [Enterococcus casseliflavus]EPH64123.1 hypothetical protein D932_01606 [Enterococcus casseliflavus 14-MB-W-14]